MKYPLATAFFILSTLKYKYYFLLLNAPSTLQFNSGARSPASSVRSLRLGTGATPRKTSTSKTDVKLGDRVTAGEQKIGKSSTNFGLLCLKCSFEIETK